MSKRSPHILIIGAGLSGLAAALEIERQGGSATLIERTDAVGGRVKTDQVKGFLLDRGFQVLLTSYPEVQRLNILDSLNIKAFKSGAACHTGQTPYRLVNPFRHFIQFLQGIPHIPPPTYLDFFKLAQMMRSDEELKGSVDQFLEDKKISFDSRHYFLEPFFGGVFLDTELKTRSQMFKEYLKLFLRGEATLPQQGMQALPEGIHRRLKNTETLFNTEVRAIAEGSVTLADGKGLKGDAVIIAIDNPSLHEWVKESKEVKSQSVSCLYFSVPEGKVEKSAFLHLGNDGPVANLCVPNHIQPSYAPKGFDLISATVICPQWREKTDLVEAVKESISSWLSVSEKELELIRSYHIKHALPSQEEPPKLEGQLKVEGYDRVFLAGETTQVPSINGALASGKAAAEAAIAHNTGFKKH